MSVDFVGVAANGLDSVECEEFKAHVAIVVTSISPNLGDLDGGYPVTITGTGLSAATSAAIGGTNITSFLVVNDNTITGVAPVGTSGTKDVTATDGAVTGTATNAFEYFSPYQLSPDGWWRDYSGSGAWPGTASSGASGSHSLNVAFASPTGGTPLNGHTPAHFTGAPTFKTFDSSSSGWKLGDIVSAGAGTIVFITKGGGSPPAYDGNARDSFGLCGQDAGDYVAVGFNTSGIASNIFDGAYKEVAPVALSTGVPAVVQLFWDGSAVNHRVGGTLGTPTAAGNVGAGGIAGNMRIGLNGSGQYYDQGDIFEIIAIKSKLSTTVLDKIRGYASTRYGVAL